MQIIGVQATTGMGIKEAGFPQVFQEEISETSQIETERPNTEAILKEPEIGILRAQAANQQWLHLHQLKLPLQSLKRKRSGTLSHRKKRKNNLTKIFLDIDRKAREYASERDRVYEELKRDHPGHRAAWH
uniref:Uncharacterized protein n=1 Tax=Bombyx mori TaxID=7091 RepID=A0A8R2QX41_BOMMO|nr:uncharacterized protein LOC119629467 [Bombyx mori]